MFELKPLSKDAVEGALDRAVRYRLLNEPLQAESICLDILEVEPENEKALITLLLALTDQFARRASAVGEARELLPRFATDYHRAYYEGIIWERKASALYRNAAMGAGAVAYDGFRQAMECYETAMASSPPANADAVLRWNTCARIIMRFDDIKPAPVEEFQPLLE